MRHGIVSKINTLLSTQQDVGTEASTFRNYYNIDFISTNCLRYDTNPN